LSKETKGFEYVAITENVIALVPTKPVDEMHDASESVTTTCIALPNELIFVDCGSYPELVRKFRVEMETRFQRKTTYLLLTHTHWDHIIAMEVFKDVNIVASENGLQGIENIITMIKDKGIEELGKTFDVAKDLAKIFAKVNIFIPNIKVKDAEFRIESNGKEIIYRVVGGHSPDSAFIYVPSEKIICTGDNLIECFAQIPGNPYETLDIFNTWESLEINNVIPGHGNIVGKEYLLEVRSYFKDLVSVLENLCTQGVSVKEAISHSSVPEYFGKYKPNWMEVLPGRKGIIKTYTRSWYRFIKRSLKSSK
jgi:glyoxylase-like metal-dependent hydrolase (beta-lactamase superfamily II)